MTRADAASDAGVGAARAGGRLGRYELCAEIARGGMASVFLGRALGLAGFEKLVAIKCIHPQYARERSFVEMFLDEARIASRITHPNVCSVFDVGEEGGVYFIAMDYLHGESLASTMRAIARDDLPDARWQALACAIAADAAEGLHAAHELRGAGGELLQVVHRDVSPQNVFLGYDGTVRVVDFGIARAVDRLHKTLSGVVKGKVAYMAPEQLRSEDVDRRADVWALGVVLWEMLTRQRLFRRDSEGKQIRAVLEDEIPAPSSLTPCPPELDAIVLRALARDRDARWQTARELGRDLRKHLASEGAFVSTAEVSEHMEQLFARERRDKEALIERTRRGVVHSGVPDTERMDRPPADVVATVVPGPAATRAPDDAVSGIRRGRTTEREYPAISAPPPLGGDGGARDAGARDPATSRPPAEPTPAPGTDAEGAPGPAGVHEPTRSTSRWRTESVVLPVRKSRVAWALGALACAAVPIALLVVGGRDGAAEVTSSEHEASARPSSEGSPVSEERPLEPAPPVSMAASPDPPPENASARQGAERPPDPRAPARPVRDRGSRSTSRRLRSRPAAPSMTQAASMAQAADPPVPPEPGRVVVGVAGGWGTITVDGRPMGQAPRALELPAGRHVIEVMPFGEGPARREVVDVRPGGTHRIVIEP